MFLFNTRTPLISTIGGNFFEAPNPIDFDKVFTEFTRLGETGNISVPVTIALLTVSFSHLHYNVIQRGCEAISG